MKLRFVTGCVLLLLVGSSCSDAGSPATSGTGAAGSAPLAGADSAHGGSAAGAAVVTAGGSAASAGVAGATEAGSSAHAGDTMGGAAGNGGAGGASGAAGSGGASDEPGPASQVGFDWGKAVLDTRLAAMPKFGTGYQEGLALRAAYLAYRRLQDPKYLNALVGAADSYAAPAGNSLDEMMHMEAVVDAYDLTKKQSYVAVLQTSRSRFNDYPKADGVFWHARGESRRQQLWADGTFMSLAFLSRYGSVLDDASLWPVAATQLVNTAKHLHNPATGLLWHAWDESGDVGWSKHPSQTNEIHWGRGMGWFGMASIMTLEALPPNDPGRSPVEAELKTLVEALAKYQDPVTGRWYQVVNMPDDARNWLETSCSSMFSYATWWAYKHHLVDASFANVAKKGLMGVLQRVKKDAQNRTTIEETCTGLNASDDLVGNYFNHPRANNDSHGVGAFLLMWEGMQ